ncbi:kinase-like protein [Tothia fuscella]|uniref:Kinase-like protein n=1 Tax=Tothia fuscella TaxID=1048955 RepID=A0A9P4TZE3_9PEZI|nr:kinase-like protein [Tothia fuscella]
MRGDTKQVDDFHLDRPTSSKHRKAKVAASRLTGRLSTERLPSRTESLEFLADLGYESASSTRANSINHHDPGFLHRVSTWLHQEKARRVAAKDKRKMGKSLSGIDERMKDKEDGSKMQRRQSHDSDGSEGSAALEKLQEILAAGMNLTDRSHSRRFSHRPSTSSFRKLRRTSTAASSDTEYIEGDALVPTCEAILDNSKTLAYSGGGAGTDKQDTGDGERPQFNRGISQINQDAWKTFKYEIVRLAHTLRLKGWRKVSMEMSSQIEVERLSGALTNAVYVVSPPKEIPHKSGDKKDGVPQFRKPPPKLLLRIYGTNVDHLIDRESELQILRRLARKRIGPRLLGTFTNGRFEEFLHARALNPEDLHDPSISKQIAKRFRELHDGIELLPQERKDDPFVWQNIDKWMPRCTQIVTWIDSEADSEGLAGKSKKRPLVCGMEWSKFREVVENYRKWLYQQYGGDARVKSQLVFAHNDAQYGNLLRMVPSGESPLMLPANEHKQLVVIDFEYANANLPGLEFANHFTEWCYNYHDPNAPHACNHKGYPTPEEQKRFLRAYVSHKTAFNHSSSQSMQSSVPGTPSLPQTPQLNAASSSLSTSNISSFMLDSRAPRHQSVEKADEEAEKEVEKEVNRLMEETRLWRLANSAQWVMWGVMQAKIPNLPDFDDPTQSAAIAAGASNVDLTNVACHGEQKEKWQSDPLGEEELAMQDDMRDKRPDREEEDPDEEEKEKEFDYLAYTWERAMFFWGDAVQFGLVKTEDLPEVVRREIKIVEY